MSSGDYVEYEMTVNIQPGSKRNVDIKLSYGDSFQESGSFQNACESFPRVNTVLNNIQIYDNVNNTRIPVTCNITVLNVGQSTVCHSTQSSEFVTTPEPVNANSTITATYMNHTTSTNTTITTNSDNTYITAIGDAQVRIFISDSGDNCTTATNNCFPVSGVPVVLGQTNTTTPSNGTLNSESTVGEIPLTVDLREVLTWSTLHKVTIDGTDQNNQLPTTINIIPNDTREIIIVLTPGNDTSDAFKPIIGETEFLPQFSTGL